MDPGSGDECTPQEYEARNLSAIHLHLARRAAGVFLVGAILFSNEYGPLGQTEAVKEIMEAWK